MLLVALLLSVCTLAKQRVFKIPQYRNTAKETWITFWEREQTVALASAVGDTGSIRVINTLWGVKLHATVGEKRLKSGSRLSDVDSYFSAWSKDKFLGTYLTNSVLTGVLSDARWFIYKGIPGLAIRDELGQHGSPESVCLFISNIFQEYQHSSRIDGSTLDITGQRAEQLYWTAEDNPRSMLFPMVLFSSVVRFDLITSVEGQGCESESSNENFYLMCYAGLPPPLKQSATAFLKTLLLIFVALLVLIADFSCAFLFVLRLIFVHSQETFGEIVLVAGFWFVGMVFCTVLFSFGLDAIMTV